MELKHRAWRLVHKYEKIIIVKLGRDFVFISYNQFHLLEAFSLQCCGKKKKES